MIRTSFKIYFQQGLDMIRPMFPTIGIMAVAALALTALPAFASTNVTVTNTNNSHQNTHQSNSQGASQHTVTSTVTQTSQMKSLQPRSSIHHSHPLQLTMPTRTTTYM